MTLGTLNDLGCEVLHEGLGVAAGTEDKIVIFRISENSELQLRNEHKIPTKGISEVKYNKTSLANLVTYQAQRHSPSIVCFVRMYALALVRTYVRTDVRTPPSKLMTSYDCWTWWVNKVDDFLFFLLLLGIEILCNFQNI